MIISILKVIGTILLVLLGILLVILLYILFAAFTYAFHGRWEEQGELTIRVHDLLRFAEVNYWLTQDGDGLTIILLWGLIKFGGKEEPKEELPEVSEEEARAFMEEPDEEPEEPKEDVPQEDASQEAVAGEVSGETGEEVSEEETPADESIGETETPAKDASYGEAEAPAEEASIGETETPAEEASAGEQETPAKEASSGDTETPAEDMSSGETETPAVEASSEEESNGDEKRSDAGNKSAEKEHQSLDERFGISDKVKKVKTIHAEFTDESNRRAVYFLWSEGTKLLGKLLPEVHGADIVYGLGFPDLTGTLTGLLATCPMLYGKDVYILPDFECDDAYARGWIELRGRTTVFVLAVFGIRVVANKDCRKLFKKIMSMA